MAGITYSGAPSDDLAFFFSDFPATIDTMVANPGGGYVEVTDTGTGTVTRYYGTGLTFTGTTPTGGTVTDIATYIGGVAQVVVTDVSLDFADLALGTYDDTIYSAPIIHNNIGITATEMLGSGFDDTFFSDLANDTIRANAGNDTIFIMEVDGASGQREVLIHGGTGNNDVIHATNNGGSANARVDLLAMTSTGIEGLIVDQDTTVDISATSNVEGWDLTIATGGLVFVTQVVGEQLNIATLFGTITQSPGGGIWLWGTESDDIQRAEDGVRFTMSGNGGNDSLVGANQDDNMGGGQGDDTVRGMAGNDFMSGDVGDDVFYVDSTFDIVFELAGSGFDTVYTTASFTLDANVEDLIGQGNSAISLTGNGADNTILGTGGANTIVGGNGSDTLNGNAGADSLLGGNGNDTLNGGSDSLADTLKGGGNDDFYTINLGDVVIETLNAGNDTVSGKLSFTLSTNVEAGTLIGGGSFDLTGNALANRLTGNAGNNDLSGGAGNDSVFGGDGGDMLDGGSGNDFLRGDAGADVFVFADGSGRDKVQDYALTGATADRIDITGLTAVISFADLTTNHMVQAGANVEIRAGGDVLVLVGVTLAQLNSGDFLI